MSTPQARVFLDGSNLILNVTPHGEPSAYAFACIFDALTARGFSARAVFDYSVQHRLKERGAPAAWGALQRLRVASRDAISMARYADPPLLSSADASGGYVVTHADDYKEWVASHGKRPRLIRVTSMQDMLAFSFPNDEAHLSFSVLLPESVTLFGERFAPPRAVASTASDTGSEVSAPKSPPSDDPIDQSPESPVNAGADKTVTMMAVASDSDRPNADQLALIERAAQEFAETWARSVSSDEILAILRENPRIPQELYRVLSDATSAALGRRITEFPHFARAMRAEFWRTLRRIGLAVRRSGSGPPDGLPMSPPATEPSHPGAEDSQAVSTENDKPRVEGGEELARRRPAQSEEVSSSSRPSDSDKPNPDQLVLIERIARECTEAWARSVEADRVRTVLREASLRMNLTIPGELDKKLLVTLSAALGRPVFDSAFVRPLRDACRSVLRQLSGQVAEPSVAPPAEAALIESAEASRLSTKDAELERSSPESDVPSAVTVTAPRPTPSKRPKAPARKAALPRKRSKTVPKTAAAVSERSAEELEREADEWLAEPGRWDVAIDEAVTDELVKAAIRRKAMAARLKAEAAGENPKLLECRGCGKYFQFPYVIRIYRDLIWSGRKTTAELAHCVPCRKREAMQTFEAELPGLGPFLYNPGDSQVALARERELSEARTRELSAAWAAGELVLKPAKVSRTDVPVPSVREENTAKEGARPAIAPARQKTLEEIERAAEEHFSKVDWWLQDIEDRAVAAAVARKRDEFCAKLSGDDPKSLRCRDCQKYFPFPYAFSVYYLMVWTERTTAEELAHCKSCREQKGMKPFEEEVPGQGPFRFEPVASP